jgi:hypothetical protein
MENLKNKLIVTLDQSKIQWEAQVVTHMGKSVEVQVPNWVKGKRGPDSATDTLAFNNIALYTEELIEQTKGNIEKQIQLDELLESEKFSKLEQELEAARGLSKTKPQKLNRGIAWLGITLLGLATIFTFLMNIINVNHFFFHTFEELVSKGFAWVCVVLISVLMAGATPFFVLLKNQKMVTKTIWIIPLDLIIAFLIANDVIPTEHLTFFNTITIIIYAGAMLAIIYSISSLFIGKGIENEKEHYEGIFNSLLRD